VPHELLLQHPPGLDKKASVDRLVGDLLELTRFRGYLITWEWTSPGIVDTSEARIEAI
jgi:hypothetical protein